jgi:hypothetical protein
VANIDIKVYNRDCEEGVEQNGEEDQVVNGAFGEAEDKREAPGFVADGVGEGVGWAARGWRVAHCQGIIGKVAKIGKVERTALMYCG